MQIKNRVLLTSIGFGLLFWPIDTVLDYFFFYDEQVPFVNLLVTAVPTHELFVRVSVLIIFTIFGFIMARIVGKQAIIKAQLYESEARFRAFMDNLPAFAFIKDSNGRHLYANKTVLDSLNCSLEEYIGTTSYDYLPPNISNQLAELERRVLLTQQAESMEVNLPIHPTESRYIRETKFPLPNTDDGTLIGGLAFDITRQKEAEHFLQATLDSSHNGIMAFRSVRDESGQIIDFEWLLANKVSETIVGSSEESLLGKHLTEQMPGTKAEGLFDLYVRVVETGETLNHDHYYAHDSIDAWLHAVAVKMGDGFVITFADITEQKLTALAEQEQRTLASALVKTAARLNQTLELDTVLKFVLTSIEEVIPHDGAAIILFDADKGHVQFAQICQCYDDSTLTSPALNQPNGLANHPPLMHMMTTHQPLLISDTADHLLWPKQADSAINSFLGSPILVEERIIGFLTLTSTTPRFFTDQHQDRLRAFMNQAAMAIRNAQLHENVQAQLEQLHDAQARLIRSQQLAAIGELVAGIAHELNNPLTSIILYSQLLKMSQAADVEMGQNINQIVNQAQRASSIVHGLLDFARQRPMERNPIQINDVLQKTVDLLAYELRVRHVKINLQLADDLPQVVGDAHQLQQVFLNLLNNALQAQEQNGEGQIRVVSTVGLSKAPQPVSSASDVVRILIQDNGLGIAPAIQSRIFDPFFTTKAAGKGTGLGLSVCQGIVHEHGGHIWVESEVGEGATFFVELPMVTTAVATHSKPDEPIQTTVTAVAYEEKPHILFIDDEEDLVTIIERMLKQYYQIDMATDARTALAKVATNSYDMLICDVHMPDIDGLTFYERWQKHHPHQAQNTPFLFITGDTINVSVKEKLESLKTSFLVKPFGIDTLLQQIQVLLPDSNN